MSLFPGVVDREWLDYLSEFPPAAYILAQHICPGALDSYQGRECQIVFSVVIPLWLLQWVIGDAFDAYADDESLEEIFGHDADGIMIDYCPFCGDPLPALGNDTCLDPWDGGPPITMSDVVDELRRRVVSPD
jgi:hypothetical protein